MDWDLVRCPLADGGLGVRMLDIFNKALLGKWLWHFACERNRFWSQVVGLEYWCGRGGWTSVEVLGSYGTRLWKGIRRVGGTGVMLGLR